MHPVLHLLPSSHGLPLSLLPPSSIIKGSEAQICGPQTSRSPALCTHIGGSAENAEKGRGAGGLLREAEHRKWGQVGIHDVFLIGMKHWRQLGKASEDRDNLSWSLFPPLPDPLKIDNLSLLVMLIFSPSWKVGKKHVMLPLCARQDTSHLPFILLTSGQS